VINRVEWSTQQESAALEQSSNRYPNEAKLQRRPKPVADAMYAHCRIRCNSDASRLFVKTVVETLEAQKIRKYARRGALAAKFAKTVEGFLGDLMLARMHPVAAGWVFRPLDNSHFRGTGTSYAHFVGLRADLEFLGLIERAPPFQTSRTGVFEDQRTRFNRGAPRYRATLKLIAMARDSGVDLDALGKHFAPSLAAPSQPRRRRTKQLMQVLRV
jgi:hypothetical protein